MRRYYGNKKYNRKWLLRLISFVFVILFVIGSFFIYNVLHEKIKFLAPIFSISIGIFELFIVSFLVTDPFFQNSKDFEINEMQDVNKKRIKIRYKDYEFEFFDKFNMSQMDCFKKNNKTISIINKYRIKRYYKYALLNILNKPMDFNNIEQYKSVRKATSDEILEFTKAIENRRKSIIRNEFIDMLRFIIPFAILCSVMLVVNKLNTKMAIFVSVLASFVVFLCMKFTDKYERYRSKQEKNAKKILKIINKGQLFIVETKELLYDYIIRLYAFTGDATRLAVFVDNEGNYINKWIYDGVIPYYRGLGLQEFPDNVSIDENIYIIKYNGKILVDTKKDFKG